MWRVKTDTKFKNSFFPVLIYWNDNRIHLGIIKKLNFPIWFPPPSRKKEVHRSVYKKIDWRSWWDKSWWCWCIQMVGWGNNGRDTSLSESQPQQSGKTGQTSQNTETEHMATWHWKEYTAHCPSTYPALNIQQQPCVWNQTLGSEKGAKIFAECEAVWYFKWPPLPAMFLPPAREIRCLHRHTGSTIFEHECEDQCHYEDWKWCAGYIELEETVMLQMVMK